jgi:hypothetical protein
MSRNLSLTVSGILIVIAIAINLPTLAFGQAKNIATVLEVMSFAGNVLGFLGIAWGGPTMLMGLKNVASGRPGATKKVILGAAGVAGGLAIIAYTSCIVNSGLTADLFC